VQTSPTKKIHKMNITHNLQSLSNFNLDNIIGQRGPTTFDQQAIL